MTAGKKEAKKLLCKISVVVTTTKNFANAKMLRRFYRCAQIAALLTSPADFFYP
jgi:hypothetical protein